MRSLRARLLFAHAVVMFATIAALALLLAREERRWVLERNGAELTRVARLVASTLAHAPVDAPGFAAREDSLTGCRITLIARDGRVVADSRADAQTLENHADRPEVRAALTGAPGVSVRHSMSVGLDLQYAAVPAAGSVPWAVVRVAEPLAELRVLDRGLLSLTLVAAGLALVVTFPLVWWLSSRQAGRVVELQRVAERVGAGDATARALERPEDEIGWLGAALNAMSRELRARLEAIERERDEREQVLAHLSDGVALIDAQDRLTQCNHGFAALLGAPRPAPPGTPLLSFARTPEVEDLITRARAEGREVATDLRLWSPQPRVLRASATPLGAPEARAVLLVLHDLTEIERVQRVRQDFVANVSHELRTPLTSLRGYAETLLDGGLDDAAHRVEFVRVIRDQAVRLQALVDDLLSLAELERSGAPLRVTRFDLRGLLEEQLGAARAAAARAGLSLVLEPGERLDVEADRARVEQVVANLLDNAVKYTERGGVTVSAGGGDARVWCEVRDTGPGIPPEDQPRVFERFYRVDKNRSREKGGTGLGLSIVKHILALHGGEVSLTSASGTGSTFRFELPRRR